MRLGREIVLFSQPQQDNRATRWRPRSEAPNSPGFLENPKGRLPVSSRLVVAFLFSFGLLLPNIPPVNAADFTQQVVDLTNAKRTSQGLPPLTVSASLTSSAQS